MDLSATASIQRSSLRVGELLAEGGEGRVHELLDRPGLLYKAYRQPRPAGTLDGLVGWPSTAALGGPAHTSRIAAAAAWPSAVVVEPGGDTSGLLIPRAPRRFSVRHRDGVIRLATLSYLAADPGQRAAAYGLALPGPWSPERIGLAYALARLLEAWQSATPSIAHGDLSAKNVLWSLERGPEVFVLDCDSCERYDAAGRPLDASRRRAMTPNWDDPAVPSGGDPDPYSDRYSLALICLRVIAAAHFPLQARQRQSGDVPIEVEVPSQRRRARVLRDGVPLWGLWEASLSVRGASQRPEPAEWVAVLEDVLHGIGAGAMVHAVWASQGDATPARRPAVAVSTRSEVTVTPLDAAARTRTWERRGSASTSPAERARAGGWRGAPSQPAAAVPSPLPAVTSRDIVALAAHNLLELVRQLVALHARTLRVLTTRGRLTAGLVRLVGCLAVDLLVALILTFVVVMAISPWLGL